MVGVIAPILWDLYKGRSEIEVQLLSSASLVTKAEDLKDLRILYSGKEISQLTKGTFLIINSGRVAVRDVDVVEKPVVRFSESAAILEVAIERLEPSNLRISIAPEPDHKSVAISFPLLNPGDFAQFSVLIDGPAVDISANARISNIKSLEYVDRRAELAEKQDKLGWVFWVVSFFTSVFALAWLSAARDFNRARRLKRRFSGGTSPGGWPSRRSEFLRDLELRLADYFPATTGDDSVKSQMNVFRDFVANQPADEISESAIKAILEDVSRRLSKRVDAELTELTGATVVCTIGSIYLFYKLEKVFGVFTSLSRMF